MQSDGNNFCGHVVLDSLIEKASHHEDQIYTYRQYVLDDFNSL